MKRGAVVIAAAAAAASFVLAVPHAGCSCTPHKFPPSATTLPAVSGVAQAGSTLVCSAATWIQNGSGFAITYQWQTSSDSGVTWTNLGGATSNSYTTQAGDVGNLLRCNQTGTNVTGATTVQTAAAGPVISGGGTNTANLWVDNSVSGNCTRSGSLVAFVSATSCTSFQLAYTKASPGDLVLVNTGTGSYGTQDITRGTAKVATSGNCDAYRQDASTPTTGNTSQCITMKPAPGASFTIGNQYINATFLRMVGFLYHGNLSIVGRSGSANGIADSCNPAYGHDIIIDGVTDDGLFNNSTGGVFSIGGAAETSIINSSFGNALASTGLAGQVNHLKDCKGTTTDNFEHDVMLDNDVIHDVMAPIGSPAHAECIHADFPHDHIAILNTKFQNCIQQNISWESQGAGNNTTSFVTLENDSFDYPASHATAMGFKFQQIANVIFICHTTGGSFDHIVVRNNSFYNAGGPGGVTYTEDQGACTWGPGNLVTGNIFTGSSTCSRAGTVNHNLLLSVAGTGCGSDTDLGTTTAPYVDGANYNFHLNTSTGPAIGLIPLTTGYPAFDGDGNARTDPADAGAFNH